MILYCMICYIIMFGVLIDEHKSIDGIDYAAIMGFVFSPIVVPILVGMHINGKDE